LIVGFTIVNSGELSLVAFFLLKTCTSLMASARKFFTSDHHQKFFTIYQYLRNGFTHFDYHFYQPEFQEVFQ
jgi:hypothetical protein